MGRDRTAIGGLIDFVAQINIPLDISLCRRLLRDKDKYDVMKFVAAYEQYGLHSFYTRQLKVADSADVVYSMATIHRRAFSHNCVAGAGSF